MKISNATALIAGANRGTRLAYTKDDVMTQQFNTSLSAEQAVYPATR